jgi:hypothetical protein
LTLPASGALGVDGDPSPAPSAATEPTEAISGSIVYLDGAPAAGLRYYYDNIDCTTAKDMTTPRNDVANVTDLPRVNADGTFSFPSFAGQCYTIAVTDESGDVVYTIDGPTPATRLTVPSGSASQAIKIRARLATVTLKGASAGSEASPWGNRLTLVHNYNPFGSPDYTTSGWTTSWKAPVGPGGVVSFSAAVDTQYTVYFEGDTAYYPQVLGGRTEVPNRLNIRQFDFFEVPADGVLQPPAYSLKKWGPAAKFTPKLKAKKFAPGNKFTVTGLPKGWSLSYRWFIDGVPIHGAHTKKYTPTVNDAGGKLALGITAENPGYRSVTIKTKAVRLDKASPKVSVKLSHRSIKASARGEVTVKIKVKGLESPDGKIRVKVGGKTTTVALKTFDKGTIDIELPKLKKGTHKVTATYLGSRQLAKVVAKAVTLTVT